MAITIHQRVAGFVWHWKDGPGWVRTVSAELAALRSAGMRVIKVQLQDDGEVPRVLCDLWRSMGFQVWGMVGHVDGREPIELARWLKAERVRLALTGLDLNFEEDVRAMDVVTNGQWSVLFTKEARRLMPTLPMHLDSYWGPMGAGINLGAYKAIGCRFSVQTFWGPPATNLWDDPPTNIVQKGLGAQPVIPKAIIKPIFICAPRDDGSLIDPAVAIADTKAAGTKGFGLYYIDGGNVPWMVNFIKQGIKAGIAY